MRLDAYDTMTHIIQSYIIDESDLRFKLKESMCGILQFAFNVALAAKLAVGSSSSSNLREFYLQTSGVSNGAAALWIRNTTWAQSLLTVAVNWDVDVSDVVSAAAAGWSITLTTVSSPRRRYRRHKINPNRPLSNLSAAISVLAAAGVNGSNIIWEFLTEDDSAGSGFAWDMLVLARAAGFSNGATLLRPEQANTAWMDYLHEAYLATAPWPAARRHARLGFPQFLHSAAPLADCVLVELTNDDVGSFGVAVGFLRGAARQFNISWGVDLSLWWGVINGCVSDLPASLHRRVMALSYVAGATVVSVEDCGWVDSSGSPNPIATEVDRFGHFVVNGAGSNGTSKLPPSLRGVPDARVALVLPADLGWSERPSYAAGSPTLWTYANIPASARRGASAIDGLLSAAFPGAGGAFGFLAFPFGAFADESDPPASTFARSSITPMYAPNAKDAFQTSSTLPFGHFHDRNELHTWFHPPGAAPKDPAPHRPMADSRWGDMMDVLVADHQDRWQTGLQAEDATHNRYSVVVWANSSTAAQAHSVLEKFAARGGTVLVAVGSTGPGDVSLTGVAPRGEVRAVRAWRWLLPDTTTGVVEDRVERGYFLVATIPTNKTSEAGVQVVAVSEPEGLPIIVRRPVQSGWVYTCLIPFFGAKQLESPALRLLDHLLVPLQSLSIVEGLPTLYWTSTLITQEGTKSGSLSPRVAAIANNADVPWTGKLKVRIGSIADEESGVVSAGCARAQCDDLWGGRSIPCTVAEGARAAVLDMSIDAHDVVLAEVACAETI